MGWETLRYSKKAVRRAGELISGGRGTSDEVADAREKVSNFRSSHGYPLLAVTMHVRRNAQAINNDAVTARRLKRLPTILDKLERQPNMNVTSMQDLGGCRVVLKSVAEVDALVARLGAVRRAQNAIIRQYDYLRGEPGPQATGYRGWHIVYEYRASKQEYLGHRVEVQIRTELQHAWATAVETLDLFSGTRLKYDDADPDYKRYFVLVSALMAIQEGLPQPSGGEGEAEVIRAELGKLEQRVGVMTKLDGLTAYVESFGNGDRQSTLVLELHRSNRRLYINRHDLLRDAQEQLALLESNPDDNIDAVLISMSQFDQLQSAYPNYFAKTTEFTRFVRGELPLPPDDAIHTWD